MSIHQGYNELDEVWSLLVVLNNVGIPARDGFILAGSCFEPETEASGDVVLISAATAVPRRYYQAFAEFLTQRGYTAVTYDYRGIGESKPPSLSAFQAQARDWSLLDMTGVIDWLQTRYQPRRIIHVGHSYGGQTAGLLPNGDQIDAMVTVSSQSGYWRRQGGNQKIAVAFYVYLAMPLLAYLFGYMPWSKFSKAEDLPKGVALEWAKWCRRPNYLLDDQTLPLGRFQQFTAPVLAYSIADDDWGTSQSVDAMMAVYKNLTRRHIIPADYGLPKVGHFGFFRPQSALIWQESLDWWEGVL